MEVVTKQADVQAAVPAKVIGAEWVEIWRLVPKSVIFTVWSSATRMFGDL